MTRTLLIVAALLALVSCSHAPPAPANGPAAADPAEAYLTRLMAGDTAALRAGFAGEPSVDDPYGGRVRGGAAFEAFVAERLAWLKERAARLDPLRTTRGASRTIYEGVLWLRGDKGQIELPVAVVADRAGDGRATAVRVYHSTWPLTGGHRLRPALLPADPSIVPPGVVGEHLRGLNAGDVVAVAATFEPDGYFREPSGGPWVHRGPGQVREFLTPLSGTGEGRASCTLTEEGIAVAIEFNVVRFGKIALEPQPALAVYERGKSGRLHAVRIYDDLSMETLVKQ
jgi:hypothetical protein